MLIYLFYRAKLDNVSFPTHMGTHLDAPNHTGHSPDGTWSVSEIPLENLVERPLSVIDIVDQSHSHPTRDYSATVDDLLRFEKTYGRIPHKSVIIFRTGWSRYWPDKLKYYGNSEGDFESEIHFPGISVEAAQWLVQNRSIVGLGFDGPSIDCGNCHFRSHFILNPANIYLLENINSNIFSVPNKGATVTLLPLKFVGASGTPVRVIAQFYKRNFLENGVTSLSVIPLSTLLFVIVTRYFVL